MPRRYGAPAQPGIPLIRPLLGACLRQQRTRCVALVAEQTGYRSLCRILSRLHLTVDSPLADLLSENAQGLHVLVDDRVLDAASLLGVAAPLRDVRALLEASESAIDRLRDVVGRGDV